jgi:ribulose-phosphate 3-epimerase
MIRLAPSILSADFSRLGDQVAELAAIPGVDMLHVDVMDGMFVPNITFGPMIVEAVRRHTSLPLDTHLMIEAPGRYYRQFAEAGSSALTVHVEACPHVHRDVEAIRELGLRAGVAISPGTSPAALDSILPYVDLVLVMTVNPGFGGQRFIEGMLEKIARIRAMIEATGRPIDLAVDGGISAKTASRVRMAGAEVFVAGSAVFGHPEGLAAGVQEIRKALEVG